MKRKYLFLTVIFISIALSFSSCKTTPTGNNDGRNPQINNDSFTNYVPWWVTNNVPTNEVINEINGSMDL